MSKKPLAVLTITRNESWFFPIWLGHYRKQCPGEEFFVLDHESDDDSVGDGRGYTRIPVSQPLTDHVHWMRDTVQDQVSALLQEFHHVVFSEVDELLVPDPNTWTNLKGMIRFLGHGTPITATGFDVIPDERWTRSDAYDKTLIVPNTIKWDIGFHRPAPCYPRPEPRADLILLHLHYLDREIAWNRLTSRIRNREMHPDKGLASQNKFQDRIPFDAHFTGIISRTSEPISERFKAFIPSV